MDKRIRTLFLSAALLLSLAGCGKEPEPEPEPEVTPPPVEEPEPEPEPYVPAGTNPLTGEPMEPEFEDDRPVAVMFNNLKTAQPQLGVSQADIIYEVPAEGGITRMLGVYQTLEGVEELGSIRSTRPYYLELALGHDALLVHAGGSPDAYEDISAWGVDNMDGVNGGSDANIFWRDADRRKSMGYEHSMLTSASAIEDYLAQDHFPTEHREGYTYTQSFVPDGTPTTGVPATAVTLRGGAAPPQPFPGGMRGEPPVVPTWRRCSAHGAALPAAAAAAPAPLRRLRAPGGQRGKYAGKLSEETGVGKDSILASAGRAAAIQSKQRKREALKAQQEVVAARTVANPEKKRHMRAALAEEGIIAYLFRNQDKGKTLEERLPPEKCVTPWGRRVYALILGKTIQGEVTLTDLAPELTADELSELTRVLAERREVPPSWEDVEGYCRIIQEEGVFSDPAKIQEASEEDLKRYFEELKRRK